MITRNLSVILLALMPVSSFAEDLATMLSFVPREANALLAVNVKGIMNSPLAAKEGWKKRIADETMIGLLPFPETAEHALIAEQLLPGTLQGKWELVLISTTKPYSLTDIAKAEKTEIESIGRTPVCFTQRNTVILQLSPTLLGVYSPGHRQDVARWLKAQTGKPVVSSALAQVIDAVNSGNQFCLIFDMEDTLEAGKVKQFIASQKEVQEKKMNVDALSKVFSTLNTVSFQIKIDHAVHATLNGIFAQDLGSFGSVLPQLVVNALDGIGASLEEYRKGKVTLADRSFQLKTDLTTAGLRNTLSMIQPHSVASSIARKGAAGNKPEENDPAKEAQRVFKSIQSTANTAHEQAETSNNIARAMVIYDNAASKIDKLPVSQADEELQQFAAETAKTLREIASTLHTGVLDVQTLETKIRSDVRIVDVPSTQVCSSPWFMYYWFPRTQVSQQYRVETNQAEVIAAQQDVITKAVRKRNELWKQLVDKSAALKKKLATKYGVSF